MQLAHGGGGCSHDTTLAALTQGAWRRSEPSGRRSAAAPPRGIEPRPPTSMLAGGAQLAGHTALAAERLATSNCRRQEGSSTK